MNICWFKKRHYRHFDVPVGERFAIKMLNANFVTKHSFLPLIHYNKTEVKFKYNEKIKHRAIENKSRPIKYASHKDACIYSLYSYKLNYLLEDKYKSLNLGDNVLAYRPIGKSNYDFAARALSTIQSREKSAVLAFDVSSFFDTIDHKILKNRFKYILNCNEIPEDWYKVFTSLTNFHYINISDIKKHPSLSVRLNKGQRGLIATISELKNENIKIHKNPEMIKGFKRGIPQGTPISAAISNLYMIEFDKLLHSQCSKIGAEYYRYSDDILIICDPTYSNEMQLFISLAIKNEKLEIARHKTEVNIYDQQNPDNKNSAQYLGFKFYASGTTLREGTLSRQWRILKKKIKKAKRYAEINGHTKIYTKKLIRRFSNLKINKENKVQTLRNFSSYARRSSDAFGDNKKILRQVKRFERYAAREISNLNP